VSVRVSVCFCVFLWLVVIFGSTWQLHQAELGNYTKQLTHELCLALLELFSALLELFLALRG
jgi:hypothetical protein